MLYVRAANQPGFHTLREPARGGIGTRPSSGSTARVATATRSLLNASYASAPTASAAPSAAARARCRRSSPIRFPDKQLNQIVNFLRTAPREEAAAARRPRCRRRPTASPATPDRSARCSVPPTAWSRSLRRGAKLSRTTSMRARSNGARPSDGARARRQGHQGHRQRPAAPPQRAGRHRGRPDLHRAPPPTARSTPTTRTTARSFGRPSIEGNPEGLVSIFEVNGRQYVAFCASGTADEGNQTGAECRLAPRQTRRAGLLRLRPAERLKEMTSVLLSCRCGLLAPSRIPPAADGRRAETLPPSRTSPSARAARAWGPSGSGAADNNIWFGWHVAIPAAGFKQLTFSRSPAEGRHPRRHRHRDDEHAADQPRGPQAVRLPSANGRAQRRPAPPRRVQLRRSAYRVDNLGDGPRSANTSSSRRPSTFP